MEKIKKGNDANSNFKLDVLNTNRGLPQVKDIFIRKDTSDSNYAKR